MSYPQETFHRTHFTPGSFWAKRRAVAWQTTLPAQLAILKSTGRYDAFRMKWHPVYAEGHRALFWDSDVGKWLESACYFLAERAQDPDYSRMDKEGDGLIDEAVRELTAMIGTAQCRDGYLNIRFTVVEPGKRFTNIRDLHELYNAGHLLEAALIHHQHYQNDLLLSPMLKYVDLLCETFGPGPDQIHGYPGHPEIELALLRLYERTGHKNALKLAQFFITERGNPNGPQGQHFYLTEAEQRGEHPAERPWKDASELRLPYWYQQAHQPILEQQTIEGHSVRAMYLLTAVADLVRISRSSTDVRDCEGYKTACERLWNNMVDKKMYLTGGIGSRSEWEGFGVDYLLPQGWDEGGCYAETCASIGVMMMAERMLQLDLDGKYADIMELALYNTVLGNMSQDGKEFLYENHLASCPRRPMKRESWFDCACCPPNVARTMGMLGGYMWSTEVKGKDVTINVHLFNPATLKFQVGEHTVTLQQRTNWPWNGTVVFVLDAPSSLNITIRLRVPAWTVPFEDGSRVQIRPELPAQSISKSYLMLPPEYTSQHVKKEIEVSFSKQSMAPRLVRPHPYTSLDTVAVARGPLIYCAEDVDNDWVNDHFKSTAISRNAHLQEIVQHNDFLDEDFLMIKTTGVKLNEEQYSNRSNGVFPGFAVTQPVEPQGEQVPLILVPYYYRGNRGGRGHMRVGFKRSD
ncbi:hypothetical protein ASPZODRAFT_152981 [Penicilliopsis zonata CBS 506.65]|uniref:Uncharacterized protein n=1 Tax=Penicilliopsis zonata CBS 506.65 TaxID=1073090 RepID=A0A1L9SDZ8_9EURO|nr:hypothetical protein ASPZODRAFT_152981 [Penicilliopsis zonata CBS 506.65]OJJ45307.1 hypothetical protein ASPZODRAFT_152981 [Penicilliopsis zonata CBS 506.65]